MPVRRRAHGCACAVHRRAEFGDPPVAVWTVQPGAWRAASRDLVASVSRVEADSSPSFLRQLYRAGACSLHPLHTDRHVEANSTQRYEQIFSYEEKDKFLASWGLEDVNLDTFRQIFGATPFFSAGGWNDENSWGLLESGRYDALLFGRLFTSNPDLVNRLQKGIPLTPYDRTRFYGPFEDNAISYTTFEAAD